MLDIKNKKGQLNKIMKMIFHFYFRGSLKTPQNKQLEDRVLENNVSGNVSEHR